MPLPTVTPLPTPPSRSDADGFAARADSFLGALPQFTTELNALATEVGAVYFPPAMRNRVINGDFSIWQRAATQTSNGYGSDDRWINSHNGSTKTHSRQSFVPGQTAVPGEPEFFSRTVVSSAAAAGNFVAKQHRIEGVRSFAGRNARVSFWAKADASRQVALDFLQRFGTGGSPSADVSAIGAQKFSFTNAWQKFAATIAIPSISGKTLGTNRDDYLEVVIWFDAGSSYNARTATLGQQSGTFDLALFQIEEGSVDTAFEFRPPQLELAMCRRYGRTGGAGAAGRWYSATNCGIGVSFDSPMRAAPTPIVLSSATVAEIGVADRTATPGVVAGTTIGTGGGYLLLNGFSGATAGNTAIGANDFIFFSAEL